MRGLRARPVQQHARLQVLQGEPGRKVGHSRLACRLLRRCRASFLVCARLLSWLCPRCRHLQTCQAGTFSMANATTCRQCSPGYYSMQGSAACSPW